MKQIKLDLDIKHPFGNLYRKACVLVAVGDSEGRILVGAKPYMFPPSIVRLLGGGVDTGESIELAAVRELNEETGVNVMPEALVPLARFDVKATDETGKVYEHQTHLYYVDIQDQKFQASDDVKQIVLLSVDELDELGDRYDELPDTLWYNGSEGLYSWADYAKMYGPIHHHAAQEIRKLATIGGGPTA